MVFHDTKHNLYATSHFHHFQGAVTEHIDSTDADPMSASVSDLRSAASTCCHIAVNQLPAGFLKTVIFFCEYELRCMYDAVIIEIHAPVFDHLKRIFTAEFFDDFTVLALDRDMPHIQMVALKANSYQGLVCELNLFNRHIN